MIFNSFIYVVFLLTCVVIYFIIPIKIRWVLLILASIGYYMSFIPVFIIPVLVIVIINYFLALRMAQIKESRSKYYIVSGIALNIIILIFFKYFNSVFPDNHLHLYTVDLFYPVEPINRMILPLGLSYIVFTVVSYLVEVKRKNIEAENHFGYYSLYLLFFPKITQGPIERPQTLIPQFKISHPFNYELTVEGLKLILWGYFKKLVVADRLAIYVNAVYNNSEQHTGPTLIIATIFFAFQIYADFSGYTDIALGSAKLFGFNLTTNFRRPYFSTSIKDFWDRWHITFSTWLRDYIFLPVAYFLAGKMKKEKYLYVSTEKWIYLIAILFTFIVCGLWHGVGWTYLIWGIIFGLYLTWSQWTKDLHKSFRKKLNIRKTSKSYLLYKIITTFLLVSFAWIFFRADSLSDAFQIIRKIFTSSGKVFYENPSNLIFSLIGIIILCAVEFRQEYLSTRWKILYSKYPIIRMTGIVLLVLTILLIGVFDGGQFIYFQF